MAQLPCIGLSWPLTKLPFGFLLGVAPSSETYGVHKRNYTRPAFPCFSDIALPPSCSGLLEAPSAHCQPGPGEKRPRARDSSEGPSCRSERIWSPQFLSKCWAIFKDGWLNKQKDWTKNIQISVFENHLQSLLETNFVHQVFQHNDRMRRQCTKDWLMKPRKTHHRIALRPVRSRWHVGEKNISAGTWSMHSSWLFGEI